MACALESHLSHTPSLERPAEAPAIADERADEPLADARWRPVLKLRSTLSDGSCVIDPRDPPPGDIEEVRLKPSGAVALLRLAFLALYRPPSISFLGRAACWWPRRSSDASLRKQENRVALPPRARACRQPAAVEEEISSRSKSRKESKIN